MNGNLKRYLRRTYKNKIVTIMLLSLGIFSTYGTTDRTFLVFTVLMGLPLFLVKENYICV